MPSVSRSASQLASLLRFILFAAVAVALILVVAVPLLIGPVVGSMVRDAGFPGQDLHVDVNLIGGGLFSGRAESVHVQAKNVNVPHGQVGDVDLTLKDVSAMDHTFSAVSGTLHNVQVSGPNGIPVVVGTVDLNGPATTTQARGTISGADAERLVSAAATAAGSAVDSVKLGQGGLSITSGGKTTQGKLRVAGRALILDRDGTSTVLIAPAPSEHWHLEGVTVTPGSIQVDLEVDTRALAKDLPFGAEAVKEPAGTPKP
jgi:hypothetical protein